MLSKSKKDDIFKKIMYPKDFIFDRSVTDVFDDMVNRSIPFYSHMQTVVADIAEYFSKDNTNVYDLGCSTGNTLIRLQKRLKQKNINIIGIDNSSPMIEKTKKKLKRTPDKRIKLVKADITKNLKIEKASIVIIDWTLQFINPSSRNSLIKNIYKGLIPKGCLIVNEKIISPNPVLDKTFRFFYHNFKKRNKYSRLEISRKREALENILVPYTVEENIELLKAVGFKHVDIFFKWHNFTGFLAIKKEK